jgi:hypothetical protein
MPSYINLQLVDWMALNYSEINCCLENEKQSKVTPLYGSSNVEPLGTIL